MSTCVLPKFLTPMVVRIEDYNTDRIESWKEYFRIQQVAMRNLEDVIGLRAIAKKDEDVDAGDNIVEDERPSTSSTEKDLCRNRCQGNGEFNLEPRLWEDTYTFSCRPVSVYSLWLPSDMPSIFAED